MSDDLCQGTTSIAAFRAMVAAAPPRPRWELVDGMPTPVPRPTIVHQAMVGDAARALDDAFALTRSAHRAVAQVEVGLGSDRHVPLPDVVITADPSSADAETVVAATVVVEVASADGDPSVGGTPWTTVKAALYRGHAPCEAVLVVSEDRVTVRAWVRDNDGWSESVLTYLADVIEMRRGVRLAVGDLYRRTRFAPSASPSP